MRSGPCLRALSLKIPDDQTTATAPASEALRGWPACRCHENHSPVPCSRPAQASVGCPRRAPPRHETTGALVRAPHGSVFGRAVRPDSPQDILGRSIEPAPAQHDGVASQPPVPGAAHQWARRAAPVPSAAVSIAMLTNRARGSCGHCVRARWATNARRPR